MTLRIKLSHLVVGLVAGALLVGAGYALATTRNRVIHACVNSRTRALTVSAKGRCTRGLKALTWNQLGPRGPRGPRGRRGAVGATGAAGAAGAPASVSIGSVTTEAPGSPATVTKSGTGSNAILNFGIPQGAAGVNASGTGATAYGEVWMGSGTSELASGSNSSNVAHVGGGGGVAAVEVTGCTPSGLAEPVINATADDDPADGLSGHDSAGTAAVFVSGWSSDGSVLTFDVTTYDPIHAATANSDFSFAVYC
jgi:hypothetical protein